MPMLYESTCAHWLLMLLLLLLLLLLCNNILKCPNTLSIVLNLSCNCIETCPQRPLQLLQHTPNDISIHRFATFGTCSGFSISIRVCVRYFPHVSHLSIVAIFIVSNNISTFFSSMISNSHFIAHQPSIFSGVYLLIRRYRMLRAMPWGQPGGARKRSMQGTALRAPPWPGSR